MRTAARTKGKRVAVSNAITIPSPVGGWNARDPLPSMGVADAVSLTNWFPMTTECRVRQGCSTWATGLPGQVESLFVYSGGNTEKMFAVASNAFYDVTSTGAVGAAVVSGLTNSRWQWANVATSGGNFMYVANGVNTPYLYNGTTWTSITGASTPAITGVTTTTLNNPITFKTRVFFIQNNSLKTWYLPTSSVGGAANPIDISAVCQLGGYIVDHLTWTIDAGSGVDDYYVIVTSMGEIVVYQGTDPSSSSTWALKGVWRLGHPVGGRCMFKLGGDVLLITQDGLLPLSGALQSSRVNPRVALTDKIQQAVSASVGAYGENFGWQLLYFARENMLIMNVPVQEGQSQVQYVMNTITKSWCDFSGWEANCWALYNDQPYFGGSGFVCQAWDGQSDDGDNINANALQSFNNYNSADQKRFTMMQPIFRSNGSPAIYSGLNMDFQVDLPASPLSFATPSYGVWDVGIWDVALFGGDLSVSQNWQGVSGVGRHAAIVMKTATNSIDTRWVSTTLVFETGGIL